MILLKAVAGSFLGLVLTGPLPTNGADSNTLPGLVLTYRVGGKTDVTVSPNVQLYLREDEPLTPFLPKGAGTAVWAGAVSVELRGNYAFQAELKGALKLEINGQTVLDAAASGGDSPPGQEVRLNKGRNALVASFRNPRQGDGYVRLFWKPKESFFQPIPAGAFTHSDSAEGKRAELLHLGRELVIEHRCTRCHAGPKSSDAIPEVTMDAPSFDGIGSRRREEWMVRWISNPKATRAVARMPKVFHGNEAKSQAPAAAAFLATLKDEAPREKNVPGSANAEAGKKLFETLHCAACHNAPDAAENDPRKVSLDQAKEKFFKGSIADFLKQPDAHYAWIRMPRFKLTDEQRSDLAAFLGGGVQSISSQAENKDQLVSGKKWIQTSGCLNCHAAKIPNEFTARPLAELKWQEGCLGEKESTNAPFFSFTPDEREALRAFGVGDRLSLTRHSPIEFASRQIRNLNCAQCHGQIEGIPQLDLLGEKLKPEWASKFIAGEIPYKPRAWLEAQMPAFVSRADLLAEGMAMQHGVAPKAVQEPPIDAEAAKTGQKLVSAPPLGFSCVSCHAVGSSAATQVFEAPGINLAYSGERLLPDYAKRWIRNPILMDPMTKMPVYFDEEGKSPLAEIYGGDGLKQIDAIWQYIRLGEKMPPPQTTETQ